MKFRRAWLNVLLRVPERLCLCPPLLTFDTGVKWRSSQWNCSLWLQLLLMPLQFHSIDGDFRLCVCVNVRETYYLRYNCPAIIVSRQYFVTWFHRSLRDIWHCLPFKAYPVPFFQPSYVDQPVFQMFPLKILFGNSQVMQEDQKICISLKVSCSFLCFHFQQKRWYLFSGGGGYTTVDLCPDLCFNHSTL